MSVSGTSSLKILYVGTLPPHQGGSAIAGSQLLVALADLGHRIEAISPVTDDGLRAGDQFAEHNRSIKVLRFTEPYQQVSPDFPPAEAFKQREQREIERLATASIARESPDVVLIGRESFAFHVVGLARAYRAPAVLMFAGTTTMGILRGTYPAEEAERLLDLARQAAAAVAPAAHMQHALARLGLAGVRVIPNPVDLKRFRPTARSPRIRRSFGIGAGDLVVMHLSNLKQLKRPMEFVEAAAIAGREEKRLVFVVAGDGPLHAETEQACAERGIADRFRFLGWLDYELIPETINCADIVVMPSAGEGQALVYLETQACGRTLIASDIPAALEVIEDGQTGMLYHAGDVAQLAAKIVVAARNPELRASIGSRARQAAASHSLSHIASLYDRLLREVVAKHRPRNREPTPSA
jgi:glycosyltransferase involved in cell wall biosynthesis